MSPLIARRKQLHPMTCYHPLDAYRHPDVKTKSGKPKICFVSGGTKKELPEPRTERLKLPCGQCIGCRIDRSKAWAIRCVHESQMWTKNCFITLTLNPANLPEDGSLNKADFQLFMKRFRKKYRGYECIDSETVDQETGAIEPSLSYPIRYFHCGEYGERLERPHHHACIFNFDFDEDKTYLFTKNGVPIYTSEKLARLWSKEIKEEDRPNYEEDDNFCVKGKWYTKLGYVTIGDVNYKSAAYVARYIMKKINGPNAAAHYLTEDMEHLKEPEFITMSRRPGIGRKWFEEHHGDIFPKDFLTMAGVKMRPPSYYDAIYDVLSPEAMTMIKEKRKLAILNDLDERTPDRLHVKETCQKSRNQRLVRTYEDDLETL